MMIDKVTEAGTTIINAFFSFIIPVWYKKWKDKKRRKSFNDALNTDAEIKKVLNEIRVKYGFNRTSLTDYHNGTNSLSGFSFKNASMRYETTDENTKEILREYQNVPCSIINDMLLKLERSITGYVITTDDHNVEIDEQIVVTNKMYGVTQVWNFRIGSSLIYGCVNLVMTHGKCFLDEEQILDIKAACQKIFLLRNK